VVNKIIDYFIETISTINLYYSRNKFKSLNEKFRKDYRFLEVCLTNKFFYKKIQLFYFSNYEWIISYSILKTQKVSIDQNLIKILFKKISDCKLAYDNCDGKESIISQFIKGNMNCL